MADEIRGVLQNLGPQTDVQEALRASLVKVLPAGGGSGLGLFAGRDFQQGEVLFAEFPLLSVDKSSFITDNEFLMRNPEAYALLEEINKCARAFGHLPGAAKFPPQARQFLDQLIQLKAQHDFKKLSKEEQGLIWELSDAFQEDLKEGSRVVVENLQSEKGKKMNGQNGRVCKYESEKDRWVVAVGDGSSLETVLLKETNLKTLDQSRPSAGGILRTNCFQFENEELVFQILCRANHSCDPNIMFEMVPVDPQKHFGRVKHKKAYVIATEDIRAGDELFVDYGGSDLPLKERTEWLRLKYRFTCRCPLRREAA
uniref:SET domain-containing protein n=1 Tax=Chromera velia CCMP2878 TaxID=1169474 RepID=A0A0G4I3C4_9ALVE|mmetsp:Transcript_33001/g.65363  ORF Transcript_33001/g.65363 Transcript_33001/m.65363 type:complete len:313 (-) Transcript_33001:216-1154(-)|eukprot:Cvel_10641.t1-p1 / transcript=Cvel_10641.t1 / gene=Cvel_10641 / organism=Chromera_velia_CCMP2878 / gene_product=hypothetical protein / transcript_product=hypothetical protein / location=Cvel_scaffold646:45212-46147(+) / protein_length=312 / sequence_SO=supercontig / SO=protein_coding / is_pseudo=false